MLGAGGFLYQLDSQVCAEIEILRSEIGLQFTVYSAMEDGRWKAAEGISVISTGDRWGAMVSEFWVSVDNR